MYCAKRVGRAERTSNRPALAPVSLPSSSAAVLGLRDEGRGSRGSAACSPRAPLPLREQVLTADGLRIAAANGRAASDTLLRPDGVAFSPVAAATWDHDVDRDSTAEELCDMRRSRVWPPFPLPSTPVSRAASCCSPSPVAARLFARTDAASGARMASAVAASSCLQAEPVTESSSLHTMSRTESCVWLSRYQRRRLFRRASMSRCPAGVLADSFVSTVCLGMGRARLIFATAATWRDETVWSL